MGYVGLFAEPRPTRRSRRDGIGFRPQVHQRGVAVLWTGVECKAQHITERCYFLRVLGRSGSLGVVRSGDAIGPADGISAS